MSALHPPINFALILRISITYNENSIFTEQKTYMGMNFFYLKKMYCVRDRIYLRSVEMTGYAQTSTPLNFCYHCS